MKVIFTVDTEPSIAGYFKNKDHIPLIEAPISGDVHGKSEALGFLIRLFTEFGFKASFFIETLHQSYFSDQDIQLHLHPVWKSFETENIMSDYCHDYKSDMLADMMIQGKELIRKWTGEMPNALRTGNFSVGDSVYDAMVASDLPLASNICMACYKADNKDYHLMHGLHRLRQIYEVPATSFWSRNILGKPTLKPLQITSISSCEMKDILSQMECNGHSVAVVVTHPFEFLKSSDYRYSHMTVNHLVQKRARLLCEYLADNKDRFEVVSFSELNIHGLTSSTYIPKGHYFQGLLRSAENVLNDYGHRFSFNFM